MRKNRKLTGTVICLVAAGMVTTAIFARTSFAGDSLKKGDKIKVMWESSMAVLPEKYLNMGFVNFM